MSVTTSQPRVHLDERLTALNRRLDEIGSVLVAFSAGADSALLLSAAVRRLGAANVVAATGISHSLPSGERARARTLTTWLGVAWHEVATDELSRPGYRGNDGDRCFHCKSELIDRLAPLARRLGLAAVVTGTNADDAVAGFRPGIAAAAKRGALTPLLDAGLTKADVRGLSKRWGLPTWNRPASACLSSRIAYGVTITPSRLARVERAEAALRASLTASGRDNRDLRVRDLGSHARIELDADLVAGLDPAERAEIEAVVTGCGFAGATLDPAGFRSGSMNDLLADPQRFR